ncbi:hypothetical protein CHH83_02195 [Bacillus sp. 7586-K]|nr:hypothetical protein CHH83_02195 [Bacillus sp. 7586-K]
MENFLVNVLISILGNIKLTACSDEDLLNQMSKFDNLNIQSSKNPVLILFNDNDEPVIFNVTDIDLDNVVVKKI